VCMCTCIEKDYTVMEDRNVNSLKKLRAAVIRYFPCEHVCVDLLRERERGILHRR